MQDNYKLDDDSQTLTLSGSYSMQWADDRYRPHLSVQSTNERRNKCCQHRLALAPRLEAFNSSCLPKGNITYMEKCDLFSKESTQYHEFDAIKKVIWTPQIEILNLVKVSLDVRVIHTP